MANFSEVQTSIIYSKKRIKIFQFLVTSHWSSLTDSLCPSLYHRPTSPERKVFLYLVLCLQVISPHLVGNFDDEVAPEEVQDEKGGEQEVEDIVGWEHRQDLSRLDASAGVRL